MNLAPELEALRQRKAPLDMPPGEFRAIGHRVVDEIADRLAKLPDGPVDARRIAGGPPAGARGRADASAGRQRCWPAGERSDRTAVRSLALQRASALFRLYHLEPRADRDVRRFPRGRCQSERGGIAAGAARDRDRRPDPAPDCRALGFPTSCGGLLVSGGNMANFVCFVAARASQAPWDVRKEGAVARRAVGCWFTPRWKPTPGSRRRPICSGSAPTPSAGLPPTMSSGWTHLPSGARSRRISGSAINRFSSSAPRARSAPAPSIRCRTSPRSAVNMICGFTWTAPMARWRRMRPDRQPACARSARPTGRGGSP